MADDFADMGRTLNDVLSGYVDFQGNVDTLLGAETPAPQQPILPPPAQVLPTPEYVPPLSAPELAAIVPSAPAPTPPPPTTSMVSDEVAIAMATAAPPQAQVTPNIIPAAIPPAQVLPAVQLPAMPQTPEGQPVGFAPMTAPSVSQGQMALFGTPNYIGPSADMLADPSQGVFMSQPVQSAVPSTSAGTLGQRPPDSLFPVPLPYGATAPLGFDTFERIRAPLMFQRGFDGEIDRASEYMRVTQGRYDEYAQAAGGMITSAVGGTLGTIVGGIIGGGVSGGSGAMTGANIGGIIGSLATLIPGANETTAALFRPAIERRADAMQTQMASRRFLTSGQDVDITGTGLSTDAAQDITYAFDDIARSSGRTRRDIANITQAAGEQGLLDMANNREEIKDAVRNVTDLVGTLAEVTGDPDFRNNIVKIGQLRRLGFDPMQMSDAIRRADTYARSAGLSVDQAMQRGGLQGAALFQGRGLDAASGLETGMYSQGLSRSAIAAETFNDRTLALYGGRQGVQQRYTDAMGAYSQGVLQKALLPALMKRGKGGDLVVDEEMLGRYQRGEISTEEMIQVGSDRFQGDARGLQQITQRSREYTSEIMQKMTPEQQQIAMLHQATSLMEQNPDLTLGSAFRAMGLDQDTANVLERMSDPETLRNVLQQQRFEEQRQQYDRLKKGRVVNPLEEETYFGNFDTLMATPLADLQDSTSNWLARSEEAQRLAAIGGVRTRTGATNLTDEMYDFLDQDYRTKPRRNKLRRLAGLSNNRTSIHRGFQGQLASIVEAGTAQGLADLGLGAQGDLQAAAMGDSKYGYVTRQALSIDGVTQTMLPFTDMGKAAHARITAQGRARQDVALTAERAVNQYDAMTDEDLAKSRTIAAGDDIETAEIDAAARGYSEFLKSDEKQARNAGLLGAAGGAVFYGFIGSALVGGATYGATRAAQSMGILENNDPGMESLRRHLVSQLGEEKASAILDDPDRLSAFLARSEMLADSDTRKQIQEWRKSVREAGTAASADAAASPTRALRESAGVLRDLGLGSTFSSDYSDLSKTQRAALSTLTAGGQRGLDMNAMKVLAAMGSAREGSKERETYMRIEASLTDEQRAQLINAQKQVAALDKGVQYTLRRRVGGTFAEDATLEDIQNTVRDINIAQARVAESGTMQSLYGALRGRVAIGKFETTKEAMTAVTALGESEQSKLSADLVGAAKRGDRNAFLRAATSIEGVSGEGLTLVQGRNIDTGSATSAVESTEKLLARLERAQTKNVEALERNTNALKYGAGAGLVDLASEWNPFS